MVAMATKSSLLLHCSFWVYQEASVSCLLQCHSLTDVVSFLRLPNAMIKNECSKRLILVTIASIKEAHLLAELQNLSAVSYMI